MAAKDRLDCWLVLVDRTGESNMPYAEIEFDSAKATRAEAAARKREVDAEIKRKADEEQSEIEAFALVIKGPCFGPPSPDKGALVIGVNDYVNGTNYALQIDDPAKARELRKLGEEGEWDEALSIMDELGSKEAHIVASPSEAGTSVKFLVERQ